MSKLDAVKGVLVADAASMGLHWLYDQQQLEKIAATGDVLFRAPDENHYRNQKAFFAHAAKRIGELSHYGEQVKVAATVALSAPGFSTESYQQAFMQAFGPCGSYSGYADRPTKALIAKMLIEGESIGKPSGSDDDQHPGLAMVPGLFAAGSDSQSLTDAVRVITTHPLAVESAQVLLTCLNQLSDGVDLKSVLNAGVQAASSEMQKKLAEALAWPDYQPLVVAEHFGMPCHLHQGMPIVWHLLQHAQSFEQCIRDNVLCGGDTCGRSIMLSAMAGLAFGVPDSLTARVNPECLVYAAH